VLSDDLVRCPAVQHPLTAGVVSRVEPPQQLFQSAVRIDVDAEHLAGDASIEPFDHSIGLRRAWLGVAILSPKFGAGPRKGWGEAAAVVSQHVGKAEWERRGGFA
jgi:hypothetical protein